MKQNDTMITLELEALTSVTPFVIKTDKDLNISWASKAVRKRADNAVNMNAQELIECRNSEGACTPEKVSEIAGEWREFSLIDGKASIPLAGKWYLTGNEFLFMAVPDPREAKELFNFLIGDFPSNDHLLELFVAREEADVSLDEARNITKQLTERNTTIKESEHLLQTQLKETKKQRLAILNMLADMEEAKKKLEESENKFRSLYESSSDAVMLLDEKGFFDCNKATLEIFGFADTEEFCSKHPADLSPPKQPCGTDSMELADEQISTAMKYGSNRFEWVHCRSDGTPFPAEVLLSKMTLDGRDILQAVVRDIKERKNSEEALQKRQQELSELLDAIQTGVILIDPVNRKIVECNPAAMNMIGAKRDRIIGRTCHKFICPSEKDQCAFLDKGEQIESVEKELLTIEGGIIPVLKTVSRITLAGQDRLLETFVNISKQKQAENELRKLSYAIEQSPSTVVITDTDGNIEYVNPKFTELTGYSIDEAIGQNPRILKSGETTKEEYQKLWNTITSGGTWKGEFHNKKKNGDLFWEAAVISPVRNTIGEITNYIAIKEDITEKKEAAAQHQQLELEIQQARKLEAVGSLAAGIAHEINTPIQFIGDNTHFFSDAFDSLSSLVKQYGKLWQEIEKGNTTSELLSRRKEAEDEADLEYLLEEIPSAIEQSLEGVQRVSEIVRAMKDFAHVGQKEKTRNDINQMLQSTLTVARNELKYVADVVTDFSPDLPQIECHRNELNQVFLNLLVNAAHAIGDVIKNDESVGKGTITVSTSLENEMIVIRIADTGTGIPEAVRHRVFDQFFTTKEVGKGSGQGLAIARKIVTEKHGGSLEFETETGKGTTFVVSLPVEVHETSNMGEQEAKCLR